MAALQRSCAASPFGLLLLVTWATACASAGSTGARPGALHLAAAADDVAGLEAALAAGTPLDQPDMHGQSALWYAAKAGRVGSTTFLLRRGANPNVVAHDGTTPILVATRGGNAEVIRRLAGSGANLNATGEDGLSALAIATSRGDRMVFDALLDLGADPDAALSGSDTPLVRAVRQQGTYYLERLLRAKADPARPGARGISPLLAALREQRLDLAEPLLRAGAGVAGVSDDGVSALMLAALGSKIDDAWVERLLASGADPNGCTRKGLTPLLAAAWAGKPRVVRLLLAAGARVDQADGAGRTPLLAAIRRDTSVEVAEILLARGADPGHASAGGLTPLAEACRLQRADLIVRLWAKGARPVFEDGTPVGHELGGTLRLVLADLHLARGERTEAVAEVRAGRAHYAALADYYQAQESALALKVLLADVGGALEILIPELWPLIAEEEDRKRRGELAAEEARQRAAATEGRLAGYVRSRSAVEGALAMSSTGPMVYPSWLELHPPPGESDDLDRKRWMSRRAEACARTVQVIDVFERCMVDSPPGGTELSACVRAGLAALDGKR